MSPLSRVIITVSLDGCWSGGWWSDVGTSAGRLSQLAGGAADWVNKDPAD